MLKHSFLVTFVVVLTIVVALMPSIAMAWGPVPVSSQLFVSEGFRGQLILTMRLTSNSQNVEQAQATVALPSDFPGYFANSNNWGVTVAGKYGSWVTQLQPGGDLSADIIIQLQVPSQQLRRGCLIATMQTSVRKGAFWQPSGSPPLQLFKTW